MAHLEDREDSLTDKRISRNKKFWNQKRRSLYTYRNCEESENQERWWEYNANRRESTRITSRQVKSGPQRSLRSRVNRNVIFRSRGESDGLALIHRRATHYAHTRKTRINLNFKHRPRETGRADGTERERRASRHSAAKIAIFADSFVLPRKRYDRASLRITRDPAPRYDESI